MDSGTVVSKVREGRWDINQVLTIGQNVIKTAPFDDNATGFDIDLYRIY